MAPKFAEVFWPDTGRLISGGPCDFRFSAGVIWWKPQR